MIQWADAVNGSLELIAGFMLWINVAKIRKDKSVAGVHWLPCLFFLLWGLWNLFYYPHLGQWLSFFGGLNLSLANVVWFTYMMKYRNEILRSS